MSKAKGSRKKKIGDYTLEQVGYAFHVAQAHQSSLQESGVCTEFLNLFRHSPRPSNFTIHAPRLAVVQLRNPGLWFEDKDEYHGEQGDRSLYVGFVGETLSSLKRDSLVSIKHSLQIEPDIMDCLLSLKLFEDLSEQAYLALRYVRESLLTHLIAREPRFWLFDERLGVLIESVECDYSPRFMEIGALRDLDIDDFWKCWLEQMEDFPQKDELDLPSEMISWIDSFMDQNEFEEGWRLVHEPQKRPSS